MSRSRITKPAKLKRLAELTRRPIVGALCRGGSDHTITAYEQDGTTWIVSKDGSVEKSNYKTRVP